MRIVASMCVAIALVVCSSEPAMSAPNAVETCLRQNVSRVVSATTSLVDAANFLLHNVCVVEIAEEAGRQQRERTQRMYARARERMCRNGQPTAEALGSDPGDDADTAAYLRNLCSRESPWLAETLEETDIVAPRVVEASPQQRALAAELILEAHAAPRR
ncbi:MAG TPA: hypothetical protein VM915_00360 [Verrucomicrobiae bacterium]|nr:hypothetical protein [Verrucomicrobiae bacterium]